MLLATSCSTSQQASCPTFKHKSDSKVQHAKKSNKKSKKDNAYAKASRKEKQETMADNNRNANENLRKPESIEQSIPIALASSSSELTDGTIAPVELTSPTEAVPFNNPAMDAPEASSELKANNEIVFKSPEQKAKIEARLGKLSEKIEKKLEKRAAKNKNSKKAAPSNSREDKFAIIGGSFGIGALAFGGVLFGIVGIILGVMALKGGTSRRGLALAGVICGAIALILWSAIIAIILSAA